MHDIDFTALKTSILSSLASVFGETILDKPMKTPKGKESQSFSTNSDYRIRLRQCKYRLEGNQSNLATVDGIELSSDARENNVCREIG
jgi:hypothetical protein